MGAIYFFGGLAVLIACGLIEAMIESRMERKFDAEARAESFSKDELEAQSHEPKPVI